MLSLIKIFKQNKFQKLFVRIVFNLSQSLQFNKNIFNKKITANIHNIKIKKHLQLKIKDSILILIIIIFLQINRNKFIVKIMGDL